MINVQTKIDRARFNVAEVEKEIDSLKNTWIEKQIKNVLLVDQRSRQHGELEKMQTCKRAKRSGGCVSNVIRLGDQRVSRFS